MTITVVAPSCGAFVGPDLDRDCDVDQADYEVFESCASGPEVPLEIGCESGDLDGDNDMDQSDFGILQACMSGANIPADPTCAD